MGPENQLRVLVVDDFVPFADQMANSLRGRGYSVRVAYDGPDALRVAEGFQPHALISDVHMPGMDGFTLAQAFAEHFPRCAVLMVTMDSALLEWVNKERSYKIVHKVQAPEAVFEFLSRCQPAD
jgi:CheY-like chemotaxis protein